MPTLCQALYDGGWNYNWEHSWDLEYNCCLLPTVTDWSHRPVPILSLPWVFHSCNPHLYFNQQWWNMEKLLKHTPPFTCWRHSQCCHQDLCWSLAALIEKQSSKQWQINGIGRKVVDVWQRDLWKPYVSWAEEIRSKKTLSTLNLR